MKILTWNISGARNKDEETRCLHQGNKSGCLRIGGDVNSSGTKHPVHMARGANSGS